MYGRGDAVFKPLQPSGLHKVAMFGASGRCKGALLLDRACALNSLIAGRIGPAAGLCCILASPSGIKIAKIQEAGGIQHGIMGPWGQLIPAKATRCGIGS